MPPLLNEGLQRECVRVCAHVQVRSLACARVREGETEVPSGEAWPPVSCPLALRLCFRAPSPVSICAAAVVTYAYLPN